MSCDHKNIFKIYSLQNKTFVKCKQCGLIFVRSKNDSLNTKNIYNNYYQKEDAARFNKSTEFVVKIFRFWRALKIVFLNPKAKKILDIGSGRGYMLYYLKNIFKFNKTVGIQISEPAYNFSKNVLKLEIYNKDLLKLNLNEKFDIITMWHVLEHLERPEKYIEKINSLLKLNGLLIIEVPNFNSWSHQLTGKYWLALDPQHHLTFFTFSTLKNILKQYGFTIKKVNSFSLEYSTFTSIQSIVSWLTKTEHLFFNHLQGKKTNFFIFHLLFFIILAPPCFLINLLLYFSPYGENVCIVAEKYVKQ